MSQFVEQQLKYVWAIEAELPDEAWTVITEMDTIMFNNRLNEAGKFQAERNNIISYQKSGRLDWETNGYKLQTVAPKDRACAPEPIQLTTDAGFSTPMLSMGRKRVVGVKWLKEVARGAPKTHKDRDRAIISFCEGGVIGNGKTAENILGGLASKSTRKTHADKTDEIYNKLVKEAPLVKDFNILSGKCKPDAKLVKR